MVVTIILHLGLDIYKHTYILKRFEKKTAVTKVDRVTFMGTMTKFHIQNKHNYGLMRHGELVKTNFCTTKKNHTLW